MDNIPNVNDKRDHTLAIFSYLSNDFDTIHREIFLDKLQSYGFRSIDIDLSNSYSSDGTQKLNTIVLYPT